MTTNNSEYMRNYRANNKARLAQKDKEYQAKHRLRYRVQRLKVNNPEEVIELVRNHCGKCDICGANGTGRWKELAIDHCHTTNNYRGMLCDNCNHGLGKFKDDLNLFQKAIDYLIQYRKTLPNEYVPG